MTKIEQGGFDGRQKHAFRSASVSRGKAWLLSSAAVMAVAGMGGAGGPALAQQGGVLEEIVVTSRYREERLQQTPLAVSAFTSENLEVQGITDVDEMGSVIPNAYFRPNGANPIIGLRGKVNEDFLGFAKPTVALYTDGVYWARQTGMNFNLFDIERVEVLRGPQGTLFGKNALGGAIRIVTRQPEGNNTGYVEATYGKFNQMKLRGAMDVALADDLFMRFTGFAEKQDGYIDKLDFACTMHEEGTPELAGYGDGIGGVQQVGTTGDAFPIERPIYAPVMVEPGSEADNNFAFPFEAEDDRLSRGTKNPCKTGTYRGKDVHAGRVQLRYVGMDDVEVTLTADITDNNGEAWTPVTKRIAHNMGPLEELWIQSKIFGHSGIGLDRIVGDPNDPHDGAFYRNPRDRETFETWRDPVDDEDWDFGENIKNWGVSARVIWDITDSTNLTYLSAYRRMETKWAARSGTTQGDGTPYDAIHNGVRQMHEQIQNEIRLEGLAFDNRLEWTLGGFWFDSNAWEMLHVDISAITYLGLFELRHDDDFDVSNKSGFAHGVFSVTPELSVTAGMRYTDETNDILLQHPPEIIADEPLSTSADRIDWKAGVDYQLTDEHLLYGTVSTGFRSAGFQGRPFTPAQVNQTYLAYPQEEVLSYEVGLKGDFFDQRLRLNVAAFYDDYDPRVVGDDRTQCSAYAAEEAPHPYTEDELVDTDGDGIGDVCPAGTFMEGTSGFGYPFDVAAPSTVKGVELEVTATPVTNLQVNFQAGYNKFTSKADSPNEPGFIHPDALIQPRWNMSGGIQYAIRSEAGTFTPRVDWNYTSHNTMGEVTTAPAESQILEGYHLFNAGLRYTTPERDWEASIRVENVFNKFYWYHFATGSGFDTPGSPAPPRHWSITIRRNF